MLVATVEIWPYGNEQEKKQISRVFIANTLETSYRAVTLPPEYVYRCRLFHDDDVPLRLTDKDARFTHHREDGAEECVRKALKALREQEVAE